MSSALLKTSTVPFNLASTKRYLNELHLVASDENAERVLNHFNALTKLGYDLAYCPTTQEMETLTTLGLFKQRYTLDKYYETIEGVRDRDTGIWKVDTIAVFQGHAGDQYFMEAGNARGSVDPIYQAHQKILWNNFYIDELPEISNYDVVLPFDKNNATANTRVTIGFSNGMATQYVDGNVVHASFMALKSGFEMDMLRRNTQLRKPTGTQPR